MWALENHTPFAAERCWVRDKNGAEVWLVAVRGTFTVFPDGALEIAKEQDQVCLAPRYRGDPENSSLLYDSDLHSTKLCTDVLVHGHACAPEGRYVTQTDVGIRVGDITKKLVVTGDRVWQKTFWGMRISKAVPFQKLPLIYENAFGGWDRTEKETDRQAWEPRNPVGTGFALAAKHLVGRKLPNIEYSGSRISSWKQNPVPAGFGPVAGHWQPRLQFAGTYDKKWQQEKLPLLPDDFNEQFYQCSPLDQQADGFLQGGEPVECFQLTPGGQLRFRLPVVRLNFETDFGGERVTHDARLHTVIIEPDHPRLIMVWHTMLPCHANVLKLEKTTITDSELSLPCCW